MKKLLFTVVLFFSLAAASLAQEVSCPIPREDRVYNRTGTQCVYASLETLARWSYCKPLLDPPLTRRAECQTFCNPGQVGSLLQQSGVQYEQYRSQGQGKGLLRKAMSEHRAALFGAWRRHAMVVVSYDEQANYAAYIDNSDPSLKIKTITVDQFNQMWDGWIVVIYGDERNFRRRFVRPAAQIPIIDHSSPQQTYQQSYILIPN
jgi:hypothetical protein